MMPNVAMLHENDPKKEILAKLGSVLDGLELLNNEVLLAIYKRPKTTAGGIILTDRVLDEDKYQGKAGLVVKIGPSCDFPLANPPIALHDWVMIRTSDSLSLEILGPDNKAIDCRLVMDKFIRARLKNPELAW
jgi:co-chaperonin GroES (HSP10)